MRPRAMDNWWKFCTNPTSFGGVILEKPPRSSQKLYFLLLGKHLKVYNLTTTNGIMMKLTSIMYLNDTFHLVKKLGRNTKGVRGRKRKTSKNDLQNQFSCSILSVSLKLNTNRNIFDSLLWMASLVNIYIEFDHIWGSFGQKTCQKKSKMISSAGWKTLEHWKLGK